MKQETCGAACVCKKCCSIQESFHSAQIEQAKAARKSWEEAEKAAFKRQEAQKTKMDDSKRIARLETQIAVLERQIAEQQNYLSEVKRVAIKDYRRIARLETQIAELQKRVSELQPSASPPQVKRPYMIRGILY